MIKTAYNPTHCPAGLKPFVQKAHYIEVKTVESDQNLPEFLAGCFSYRPGWLAFLYWLRGKLVPLIGLKGHGAPEIKALKAQDISFQKGEKATFFTVEHGEKNLWVAGASEKHLTAYLAAEKEGHTLRVYTLITYHHWTGRLYYNIIRPFHHLVVEGMIRAGLK